MSYKGKTLLFDCGIHLAYSGVAALPYFDEIDPSTIDVLLITQESRNRKTKISPQEFLHYILTGILFCNFPSLTYH
ncbi:hypothetical protein CIPAW_08G110700 [Carya illinoinensis]|uniref:Uncharacterized protein n=1 Tax=Carya illinoinensis TaxID=32201 RepID=A0A8T1PLH0_CARIL|nr:hypothetical protein CIPAW_08G110700 [Carya illinoinensis]